MCGFCQNAGERENMARQDKTRQHSSVQKENSNQIKSNIFPQTQYYNVI